MEKDNTQQQTDNETGKSSRETFMQRFSSRFPDTSPDDEEAFYGKLGEEFDRIDRSDQAQKELGELLASDPRSAGFLMVMRKGGNPLEFLIEQYGDEFREALNDEGKAKEFAAAFSKYAERQARNKALQQQAEANMQKMLDDLDAAQAEGGFTDDDAAQAYEYLYGEKGLLDRIITNEIGKDDWMMLMKAAKYDTMQAEARDKIAQARNEGEIAGRNANIDIQKRRHAKTGNMPSDIASASGNATPRKQTDGMLEVLDNITKRRKSVWKD